MSVFTTKKFDKEERIDKEDERIGCHYSFYGPVKKDNEPIDQLPKKPKVHGDLRKLSVAKTKFYLTDDNPPENEEKFFTCHGKKGRDLAKEYFTHTLMLYNGDELLAHLVDGIFNKFSPGSLYRMRLMEAVCQYFGFSDGYINEKAKSIMDDSVRYASPYAAPVQDFNQTKMDLMASTIKSHTAYLAPIKKENATIDFVNERDPSLYRL